MGQARRIHRQRFLDGCDRMRTSADEPDAVAAVGDCGKSAGRRIISRENSGIGGGHCQNSQRNRWNHATRNIMPVGGYRQISANATISHRYPGLHDDIPRIWHMRRRSSQQWAAWAVSRQPRRSDRNHTPACHHLRYPQYASEAICSIHSAHRKLSPVSVFVAPGTGSSGVDIPRRILHIFDIHEPR